MAVSELHTPRRLAKLHERLGEPPRLVYIGAAAVAFWFVVAVFAPFIAPYDPIAQDLRTTLSPPSWAHPLGTDNFGRDVLSRIIFGTRLDLEMGILGVLFPFLIGITLGAFAGYFGGIVDTLLMRLLDVTIAFPYFVLVIAIIAILGPGVSSFYISVALVGWVSYARLVRAEMLVLREQDYVMACRALGFGHLRTMLRHMLPNAIIPAVVFSMTDVVIVILLGSSLSYLGLGAQPPTPEWGVMVADGQNFITRAWWITFFPGVAIVLAALSFSLFADGLAEWLGVQE
ncbi:ABC transporter permease [Ferruginivarius sediminum]|uniref:ABC transporter permease n=1 Tax=Ferruginivarius sediminum TaxID=2661937 RepID=A0A369T859_9PROT|nr:ABC transporter permease [Ferruginivarius sediminum]RDD61082.1 ABC transporter permease [Ferruginivarius sediminum]